MTGSGKTTFVCRILQERFIVNFPEKIYYFYKAKQPFMEKWNLDSENPKITFVDNLWIPSITDYIIFSLLTSNESFKVLK